MLLSDSKLREQMGHCAAEYAQDYDWNKIAAQIADVYGELTRKNSIEAPGS